MSERSNNNKQRKKENQSVNRAKVKWQSKIAKRKEITKEQNHLTKIEKHIKKERTLVRGRE